MRAQCFSAPVQRRYYAGAGSLPHLVALLLTLVVVFVPLFLAHGSRDFWPTTKSYREQPLVKLTYQVLAVFEGERRELSTLAAKREYARLVASTLPGRIHGLLGQETRAAQIKAFERDNNRDRKPDALHIRVTAPLQVGEAIHQVRAFVFLNYTLEAHAMINMDALAMYSYSSSLPGAALSADGDLTLQMTTPAQITHSMDRPYLTEPLLNTSRITGLRDLDLEGIVTAYRSRDWHALFNVPYPIWTIDASPEANFVDSASRTFKLDLTIRIPSTEVRYRPTWAEILKAAWIQYFAILVVVYALVHAVSAFLYSNRVMDTYSVLDDAQIMLKKHR